MLSSARLLSAPSRSFSTSAVPAADIGFIGLGQMGVRMALNLQKAGKSLIVYDLAKEPMDQLAAGGAQKATTVQQVAQEAKCVITMLPSNPHVLNVYTGENSLLSAATSEHVFIDASTIDPNVAKEVQKAISATGAKIVDAPVSGGINGAANATLTFMVGGGASDFAAAEPTLKLMGKNIVHCGDGSLGQVAKVCNNLVLGISMIGVSEAMNLGVKSGMDPAKLANIFNTSSARCWSSDAYNPVPGVMPGVPASNDYQGGFASDLMAKDLSLAISAAHAAKTPLPLGGVAHQTYNLMHQQGLGGKDFGVVYKFLSENRSPADE